MPVARMPVFLRWACRAAFGLAGFLVCRFANPARPPPCRNGEVGPEDLCKRWVMTVKPNPEARATVAAILDDASHNGDNEMTFTREEVSWIREALLIGLSCLGQVEQVISIKQVATLAGHQWVGQ